MSEDKENLPSENWFYEAEKNTEDVYISSLTCENAIEPLDDISSFEYFKCTYCERSEHCYKNSLSFKDLIKKEHLDILKTIDEQQISDIIFDLKRTSFHCPDCDEDEDEKDSCYSCEGLKVNGFHQFLSRMESIKEYSLIQRFKEVDERS